ncbi:hypothetical protein [Formosa sp. PL04]|uniref:hypothetical protein n=1 Tax=Formosa sp. PL04 TaxID=3081755 RepID=UPI00298220EC|nr:hypothetical protein [Formosa sp. PL04]MDW5290222.1 hypothetical protein [Formosa sp. PL04]
MESILEEVRGNNEDINEKYDLLLKELGTETPLPEEQLMKVFPKNMGVFNLDASDNGNNNPRITSDETVVGSFGEGKVRIEILDAAGKNVMGAILPLKMLHLNKITSELNNTIRYSKKERNGILTFCTDRDEAVGADYESDIRFLYDDRFYVILEGKMMDTDALWQAFDINALKGYKDMN